MIGSLVGAVVAGAVVDVLVLPRLRHAMPRVTSTARLRAIRAVLVMASVLFALVAVWGGWDWWGHGHRFHGEQHGAWVVLFAVACAMYAYTAWPPDWLTSRIKGLAAGASAVEDRPEWAGQLDGSGS